MKTFLFLLFSFLLSSHLFAQPANEIEIIFDASRSMNEPMGNSTRLAEAKAALAGLSGKIQAGARVGLRVFGNTPVRGNVQESCTDSVLTIPIQAYDQKKMLDQVHLLQAYGQTPIGYSLTLAAGDFSQNPEVKKTIILVSDGEESCGQDPLQVVQNLKAQGIDVVVHAIGFDVDAAARTQLEQIAQLTGGVYADAKNAAELEAKLSEAGEKAMLIAPQKSFGENIIAPANGAAIVNSSTELFAQLVDGKEEQVGAFYAGQEAVLAFPGNRPYLLKSFSFPVFEQQGINVSGLELLGSLEGPDRGFFPIRDVEIKNQVFFGNVYQEFPFDPPVPARYLKVVVGHAHDGSSRNYQNEWKVAGSPLTEEDLAKILEERGQPRMDLLEPGNGGQLMASEDPNFGKVMDGLRGELGGYTAVNLPTEAIITFGGKTAVIEKVAVAIPQKDARNAKTIEFSVSDSAPTGPYQLAGSFQTMNMVFAGNPFQEFQFDPPVRAKFLKVRHVDAHGGTYAYLHEIKVTGYLE